MKLSQASSTGGSFAVSKQLIYNEQLIQERKSIKQSCLRKEVILLSRKFIQDEVGINEGWRARFPKQGESGVTTFICHNLLSVNRNHEPITPLNSGQRDF
jgi:hypothetical protein